MFIQYIFYFRNPIQVRGQGRPNQRCRSEEAPFVISEAYSEPARASQKYSNLRYSHHKCFVTLVLQSEERTGRGRPRSQASEEHHSLQGPILQNVFVVNNDGPISTNLDPKISKDLGILLAPYFSYRLTQDHIGRLVQGLGKIPVLSLHLNKFVQDMPIHFGSCCRTWFRVLSIEPPSVSAKKVLSY